MVKYTLFIDANFTGENLIGAYLGGAKNANLDGAFT